MVRVSEMVLLAEPLVPVTTIVATVFGGGGGGGGLPPPHEPTPTIIAQASSMNNAWRGFLRIPKSKPANANANTNGSVLNEVGASRAFVVLPIVTVRGAEVVLGVRFAEVGLSVQVEPPGAPVQVRFTVPLKPTLLRVKL